jgi:hypothetical protein
MPEKKTLERAKKDKREGKSPSTQAGEFVREEIEHVREGKHGARSAKQAIAIGLSKARRAGVKLPPPKKGTVSSQTRRQGTRAAFKTFTEKVARGSEGAATRRQRGRIGDGALKAGPQKRASARPYQSKACSAKSRQDQGKPAQALTDFRRVGC